MRCVRKCVFGVAMCVGEVRLLRCPLSKVSLCLSVLQAVSCSSCSCWSSPRGHCWRGTSRRSLAQSGSRYVCPCARMCVYLKFLFSNLLYCYLPTPGHAQKCVGVSVCVCACAYFTHPLALPIKLYGGSLPPPPPLSSRFT